MSETDHAADGPTLAVAIKKTGRRAAKIKEPPLRMLEVHYMIFLA